MEETGMTSAGKNLASELEKFELWLNSDLENTEGKKDDYSRWPELSTAFISFLRTKQNSDWTDSEQELVARACHNDWQHHKLFKTIDASERVALMLLPFSDIGARMHMLVCARDNKSIKMEVAHFFFENDPHETIREEALITLAAGIY